MLLTLNTKQNKIDQPTGRKSVFYTHHTHIKDDKHHHHHIPLNLCGEGHTPAHTHVRFSNIKKKKLHGQTQTIITHTPRYNKFVATAPPR